ncbi:hypothetical protein FLL45_12580 [Aliikangiella marina]|uniref:Uncharacterized protein n=1 Tax=Aliikangiella marina TaxID=1712262 RepID=A0A545T911_9GAMM|nr:hypothetical protein [Aliikangiella marina]TQV73702.1 hypothetical protein FLL45_12580 [Aliikangiella marina]
MSIKLDDLAWPEATLFNLSFDGTVLSFTMTDIQSYIEPIKFEEVDVRITDISALRVTLRPFIDGKYSAKELVVDIGDFAETGEVIEGIVRQNPLTDTNAEYFWLTGELKAADIVIKRTGNYQYKTRKHPTLSSK